MLASGESLYPKLPDPPKAPASAAAPKAYAPSTSTTKSTSKTGSAPPFSHPAAPKIIDHTDDLAQRIGRARQEADDYRRKLLNQMNRGNTPGGMDLGSLLGPQETAARNAVQAGAQAAAADAAREANRRGAMARALDNDIASTTAEIEAMKQKLAQLEFHLERSKERRQGY